MSDDDYRYGRVTVGMVGGCLLAACILAAAVGVCAVMWLMGYRFGVLP